MFYIVALGNPGEEYRDTRHNVGWLVADALCERFHLNSPVYSALYQGTIREGVIGDQSVIVLYPDTFMNHSGSAVRKLVPKGEESHLLVIHDEVMLPLREAKISVGRGDGGHNGIRSIVASLGTKDFVRLRIGIAPTSFLTGAMKVITGDKLATFVLGAFTNRERAVLDAEMETFAEMVRLIVVRGVAVAMNRFN
jgi:PTH1 family peptidyl-tRNA hydrolase